MELRQKIVQVNLVGSLKAMGVSFRTVATFGWEVVLEDSLKIIFQIRTGIFAVKTDTSETFEIKATSGNGVCLNNPSQECLQAVSVGPIPVGLYYLDPGELSNPGLIGDLLRRVRGDWGDWRIPLHAGSTTKTNGRSGFFIHGGALPGSQGCIDIGGELGGNESTDNLASLIRQTTGWIKVEVIP